MGKAPSLFQETSFTDHVARRIYIYIYGKYSRCPGWRRCDGSINDRFPAIVQVYRLPYHCQQVPDLRYPPTYASISVLSFFSTFLLSLLFLCLCPFFLLPFSLSPILLSFSSFFLSFHFPFSFLCCFCPAEARQGKTPSASP